MTDNEKVDAVTPVRIFTREEREALLKQARSDKAFEESLPEWDNATIGYFQVKETQLMLDRAVCELAGQRMPLRGVQVRLNDWDFENAPIPNHKEYAKIVDEEIAKLGEINLRLLQVLSRLGNDVHAAFQVVHPDSEGECPEQDSENKKSE